MSKASRFGTMVRQGDVLLRRMDADESKLEPAPKDERGLVLAEGESSGHYHRVFGRGAKLMRFREGNMARVLIVGREGAELRVVGGASGGVARHLPIQVKPGMYEVRTQRAWTAGDEARSRQMAD